MRKTMFLIVSLMLMVTPTRAENHVVPMINFMTACKAIEKELDYWLMAISLKFAEYSDKGSPQNVQRTITLTIDPKEYDNNTKMAERWATIYTAKCPVKKQ